MGYDGIRGADLAATWQAGLDEVRYTDVWPAEPPERIEDEYYDCWVVYPGEDGDPSLGVLRIKERPPDRPPDGGEADPAPDYDEVEYWSRFMAISEEPQKVNAPRPPQKWINQVPVRAYQDPELNKLEDGQPPPNYEGYAVNAPELRMRQEHNLWPDKYKGPRQ